MAITQDKRQTQTFVCDGTQKVFPFDFKVFVPRDIGVLVNSTNDFATPDTSLTYETDYSVTLNVDQDNNPGGSVTLVNAPASGTRLVVISSVERLQPIVITRSGGFYPDTLNDGFDRAIALIQELFNKVARCLSVPSTSSQTPEDMTTSLMNAQSTAQAAADAAEVAKDAAEDILEDVQTYGEAAAKLEPIADEIVSVAGAKDAVEATGENITNVNIVAGDLDTTTQKIRIDYGIYGHGTGSGTVEVPTGGNIVTVAQNIEDIKTVAENIEDIVSITAEINKIPGYLEDMDKQVQASAQNAQNALGSANSASASAQDAVTQKNLAKNWAIKLDGKVVEADVEIDFSAKYWANQAKSSADSASATLTQVTQAGETAVRNVQSAQSTAVQAVNSAGSTQIAAVDGAKDSAIAAVSAQQTTSVNAVNTAGAQQTANAKAQADAAAQSASDALTAKTQAESAKTNAVAAKGQAETAASTATTKASEAAQSATAAGNAKTAALNAQSAAEKARAAAEVAQSKAEEVAGSLGDPLGKEEANSTYRKIVDSYTKTEVDTALNNKLDKTEKAESAKSADSVAWANVSGAPATFPPSAHSHEMSDVTGLQNALDEKQPKGSYAEATHTHTASQITDLGKIATKNEITAAELAASIDLGVYSNA